MSLLHQLNSQAESAAIRAMEVKAYMKTRYSGDVKIETLYALFPDSKIYCLERPFNSSFNLPGQVWHEALYIPADAEFIGNYEAPTNLTSAS